MNVGLRIKARRESLNLSAEKLGNLIGKAKTTIYRYESGAIENLPSTVLEPIAKALRTTPEYLMGWDAEPERKQNNFKGSSEEKIIKKEEEPYILQLYNLLPYNKKAMLIGITEQFVKASDISLPENQSKKAIEKLN